MLHQSNIPIQGTRRIGMYAPRPQCAIICPFSNAFSARVPICSPRHTSLLWASERYRTVVVFARLRASGCCCATHSAAAGDSGAIESPPCAGSLRLDAFGS